MGEFRKTYRYKAKYQCRQCGYQAVGDGYFEMCPRCHIGMQAYHYDRTEGRKPKRAKIR